MLRVGLTGGIASGKSAAARVFAEQGVPVVDADAIARELVEPGTPLLDRIIAAFGPDYRMPDGSLDRQALGRLVFAEPVQRQRLEQLTHPAIRQAMLSRLAHTDGPYAVLMVPLLIETGMTDLVDRVLVVDLPVELQRQRLAKRDQPSAERITQMLAAQVSRAERLARADDVIDNSGDLAQLERQVRAWHQKYLTLAETA